MKLILQIEELFYVYFVLFKDEQIKRQHPNVKNEYGEASPDWKVPGKLRVVFNGQIMDNDDGEHKNKNGNYKAYPKSY